jgi:putative ABC transport system permease protein
MSARLYRLLLRAYPRRFRDRFGAELELAFVEGLKAARQRSPRAGAVFLVTRGLDAVSSGLAERRWDSRVEQPRERHIMLTRFAYDLRMAVRQAIRQPGFSLIVIFTLALGIGANAAVFSVVDGVLVKPLPYRDPDQLGFLWTKLEWIGVPRAWVSGGHAAILQRDTTTIADFVAVRVNETQLTDAGDPQQVRVGFTTTNVADALGVHTILGRAFQPDDGRPGAPRVMVLSHELWKGTFGGDPGAIGRRVTLGGSPTEIIGVFGPEFRFIAPTSLGRGLSPDGWVPAQWEFASMPPEPFTLGMLVRLKPGVSWRDAQAEIDRIGTRVDSEMYSNRGFSWTLLSIRDNVMGEIRPTLWIVQAAAILVLLVAAANVASLFLVRASGRARELAVRSALGAGRRPIGRQLVMESTVLAVVAAAPAVGLAAASIALLKAANPSAIPNLAAVTIDWRVMLATAAVTVLAGVVFGTLPLINLRHRDLRAALANSARVGDARASRRLRASFVAGQIAMALVLVAAAALLIRTFASILAVDPGFNPQQTVTARVVLPATKYPEGNGAAAFVDDLLTRLRALPGVHSAGATTGSPLSGFANQYNVQPADSADRTRRVLIDGLVSTPGYLTAAGVRLLRGRDFTTDDRPSAPPVAIIDDVLAALLWGQTDPIGQPLRILGTDPPLTVVGIIKQPRLYDLRHVDRPQVYRAYAQAPAFGLTFFLRTSETAANLGPQVRRIVRELDPGQPVAGIRTMETVISDALLDRRLAMTLLSGFAAAALLLAAVGVYGLMSFTVAQRGREIGIRMALGAHTRDVRSMILGRCAVLAGIGLALGTAGSLAARRLIETQLYQVSPTDPVTLGGAALLLLAVAIAASYVPARRAMTIDPVKALRAD